MRRWLFLLACLAGCVRASDGAPSGVGDIGDTASDVRLSPDSDAASVDIKARIDGASLDVSLDIGAGHLIFVTSSTHTGKIGGLPGADAICAARAKAAARPGTYKALISDSQTDANARLSITQAVFNTAGQLVASGPADLWDGDVKNTVAYDEHGVQVTSVFRVWCGTRDSGVKYGKDLCQDWGSDAKTHWGEIGTLTSKVTWIDDQAVTCDKLSRIYCISQ